MVKDITDDIFQQETSEGLVLIDFWAPWCGPCRMQTPILQELSEQYKDQLKIVKVNVDENPNTSRLFNIMSIPTLLLKKDNQVVETLIGVQPKQQLETILKNYL